MQSSVIESLLSTVQRIGLPYGREDSFKLLPQSLLSQRIILGIDTRLLTVADVLAIFDKIDTPAITSELLAKNWAQASAVFVAVEAQSDLVLYKVYLEYWQSARSELKRLGHADSLLMGVGLKWLSGRPSVYHLAEYIWLPSLSVKHMLRQLGQYYAEPTHSNVLASCRTILKTAINHVPNGPYLFLQVQEKPNPRNSFDLNLYPANLTVADVATSLARVASELKVPDVLFQTTLQQFAKSKLGHLSGGLDRQGLPFLTVYADPENSLAAIRKLS